MSTATVSASVDSRTKALANEYIRKSGKTPNQLIKDLWERIARTGEVPDYGASDHDDAANRVQIFDDMTRRLNRTVVKQEFSVMSDGELEEMIRSRDL